MADIFAAVNVLRDTVVNEQWFTDQGFDRKRFFLRFLPQTKNPDWPIMTVMYDPQDRERFADIDNVVVTITIWTKDYPALQPAVKALVDTLHQFKYADANVILFKVYHNGAPPTPGYDMDLNVWKCEIAFDCAVG